jgi:hypothetical protein
MKWSVFVETLKRFWNVALLLQTRVDAWTSVSSLIVCFFLWGGQSITIICQKPVICFHRGRWNKSESRCAEFCYHIMPSIWKARLAKVKVPLPERCHSLVAHGVEAPFGLVDYKSVTFLFNFVYKHEFCLVWHCTCENRCAHMRCDV